MTIERAPVASRFFTASSSAKLKASTSKQPLQSQTSVISISDGENEEPGFCFIDAPQASTSTNGHAKPSKSAQVIPAKRSSASNNATSPKKPKVAPLFKKRTSALSAQVKLEEAAKLPAASIDRLQKFRQVASSQFGSTQKVADGSSSPLPEIGSVRATAPKHAGAGSPARGLGARGRVSTIIEKRAASPVAGTSLFRKSDDENDDVDDLQQDLEDDDDDDDETDELPPTKKQKAAPAAKGKGKGKAAQLAKFAHTSSSEDVRPKGKRKRDDSTAAGVKYTPLEQQYLDIKAKYPDTLLIIEVGYKFRFFGDDAKIAAKELNVACFMNQNFYSAMIPVHRLDIHIKRLITAGHKVGVVRQKETAALKKAGDNRSAPFIRELSNLYTAGTYVEALDAENVTEHFHLGSIVCLTEVSLGGKGSDEKVTIGLVAAQPKTGEVIYDQFEDGFLRSELETRLLHLQPAEVVIQGSIGTATRTVLNYLLAHEAMSSGAAAGRLATEKAISVNEAVSVVTAHLTKGRDISDGSDPSSDVIVIDASPPQKQTAASEQSAEIAAVLELPEHTLVALAGLLNYLSGFGLASIFKHPRYFVPFTERGHMLLTANTIANLEIFRNQTDFKTHGSLFALLDHTKTPFGQRLLRRWVSQPLLHRDRLQERVAAVDEVIRSNSYLLGKLRGLLKNLPDLERGLARVQYGKATPQEVVRLLMAFQRIGDEFPKLPSDLSQSSIGFKSPQVNDAFYALPKIRPVVESLLSQLNVPKAREGVKADMFLPAHEVEAVTDCKDALIAIEVEFKQHLKDARLILKKPQAQYVTVALEEYLLEVRISEAKSVPADWTRVNGTKTVYRYRSQIAQRLLEERNQALERLEIEAEAAFLAYLELISGQYADFRAVVTSLSYLDCILSLALVGLSPGYVKPTFVDRPSIAITAGRHPIIEQFTDNPFIPNDVDLSNGKTAIVTGCNMSGKSSYSRMVALLVIMAQIGCYLPCDSAELGLVDYVGTRFGAQDELARGRSTFMVELTETCEIIKSATERSLIVLDELGRGTSTTDGQCIAAAVLEYIVTKIRCPTLFITHFPQMQQVARAHPERCGVFQMAYTEEQAADRVDITFLYKLVPGLTDRVHGINCARLAGLPSSVCHAAALKSEVVEQKDAQDDTLRVLRKSSVLLRQLLHPQSVKHSIKPGTLLASFKTLQASTSY